MDDYIKSLQDNNDIFSGNKIFLTGKSGLAYGHYEALVEDLYSAKSSGLVHPDDLAEMKSAVNAARADYQAAMREQYPDFFTKQINDDMPRKTKEQAKQKEPAKTAKAAVEEKPVKQTEVKTEQTQEAKAERQPREPQMVTVNGDKVSHGHAFQSNTNPENWYFTAKINGRQLNPQKMDPADLTAFQKKEIDVPGLMAKYYPTKIAERLPFDKIKADNVLEDGHTIDRFNIYKETREGPNKGKYMVFAQVGDDKVSARASQHTLNAFFDRTETYSQMVTKNLGERLHLKSAYQQYSLPEAAGITDIRAVRNTDGLWYLNAKMDGKDMAGKQLDYNDGYAFFKAKTATAEQLAGKYFHKEIADKLGGGQGQNIENSKSASIKLG